MTEPHILRFPEPTPANAARMKTLEARSAAAEHIEQMVEALEASVRFCAEVADGGENYPAGVREVARVEQDRLAQRAASVRAIVARNVR